MTTEILTITPEAATQILQRNTKNRKLNKRRISLYANAMRRGEWRLTHQGIAISKNKEIQDGQHRLHACIEANTPFQAMVTTGCDDDNFQYLDIGRNRSFADSFFIDGISNSAKISTGISKYMCMQKYGTASFVGNESRKTELGLTPRLALLEYWRDPEFYQTISSHATSFYNRYRFYSQASLFAFMAYLHKVKGHSLTTVVEFLEKLYKLNQYQTINTQTLLSLLIKNATNTTKYSTRDLLIFLIMTWNNEISGKDKYRLKITADTEVPELL